MSETVNGDVMPGSHNDPSWLRHQYHENGLTTTEIGDLVGVSNETIRRRMIRFGIERRSDVAAESKFYATFTTVLKERDDECFEAWYSGPSDDRDQVRISRLLAVAEYGFDAVCEMNVYHKNRIPWDNRPENIELLTPSEQTPILHGHRSLSD